MSNKTPRTHCSQGFLAAELLQLSDRRSYSTDTATVTTAITTTNAMTTPV